MRKYDLISALSAETSKEVARNEESWKGMVAIRDCTQELINFQLEEYPEDMIQNKQTELNQLPKTGKQRKWKPRASPIPSASISGLTRLIILLGISPGGAAEKRCRS